METLKQASNKETFYETHRHGFKSEDDATSKIAKLKELKDKGAISKDEFEKKKRIAGKDLNYSSIKLLFWMLQLDVLIELVLVT